MSQEELPPLESIRMFESTYHTSRAVFAIEDDFFENNFITCQRVAEAMNITLSKPTLLSNKPELIDYLHLIADYNSLRIRRVRLTSDWWLHDNGPLLGFYNNKCCALLLKGNHYILTESSTGKTCRVNASIAKNISEEAYVFYLPFPEPKMSLFTTLKFTFSSLKKDILMMIFFQMLSSIILLSIPIFSGIIFSNVVPSAAYSLLLQYTIFLVGTGIVVNILSFLQTLFMLRIRVKAQQKIQVAIWDKLLKLPVNFFKNYTPGDLSFRCSTITDIQEILGENILTTIMSGFLSITNLFLMFYIDFYLALAGAIIIGILAITSFAIDFILLRQQREIILQKTKINSLLLSLVNAIAKIRMANKETNAFHLWSKEVTVQMKSQIVINRYVNKAVIFNIGFMGLSTLVIYTLVVWRGKSLDFGQFIVFNAAFVQFAAAIIELTEVINQNIEIIPLFKLAKPILESEPEVTQTNKIDLTDGHIQIQNIVFRYENTEKPLFLNLSVDIPKGSYVAFVGPSGAGKSTLFRLLLGLEKPESGSIKYNGVDLNTLQLQDVRAQMGVVMQSTQLIPGTLLENICGKNQSMSREEAWVIATQVGLTELIHSLPMGMDTLINDGIQTFSGGEIQRINLARAISSNPHILLLDEATSALDNIVQSQIHLFLKSLNITRLLIAHRFSTIVDADIIYVIDKGMIVESGSYRDLFAAKGLFYQLASRQI
jgi:NHLM bacteriocin system ABC transporter ATP-binding protein